MNELSLFTGAGGGLLGTHHLLGWRTIGMVEIDEYCQKVLRQRQRDGYLDDCPMFGDIRAFIGEGYAERYRGVAQVITAGFPCQPFSVAGKRLGVDDERNMWPETIEVIRLVRPRFCLLENTPGLLSGGYFGTVLSDLAESGFDARWRVLSAAEVGAPHLRDRVWIVAYSRHAQRRSDSSSGDRVPREIGVWGERGQEDHQFGVGSEDVADPKLKRPSRQGRPVDGVRSEKSGEREANNAIPNSGWGAEPNVGRVANGVASRVDRLKAIGNGQVSRVAATVWQLLINA